jgi:hypothetical protein
MWSGTRKPDRLRLVLRYSALSVLISSGILVIDVLKGERVTALKALSLIAFCSVLYALFFASTVAWKVLKDRRSARGVSRRHRL